MTRPARLFRAVLSAVTILLILVALPLALWFLGRPLLPAEVPSGTQVLDALSRPDDGSLLLGLLVLVGVLAWLLLAFSIVAEIISVVVRRPVLRIGLPGFRFSRGVAAALVAQLLGLGGTPALAAPAAISTTAVAPDPQHTDLSTADSEPDGPVHVVQGRDTLWRIAEQELGDPLRWREIYELNKDRPQPDGGMLTEASLLHAGWTLILPADSRPTAARATVEPGDSLGSIAAERLGSPTFADDIFDANRGRPQRDGQVLVDPDVIRPGWILTLPAPAEGPGAPAPPPAGSGTPPPLMPPPPTDPPPPTSAPSATQGSPRPSVSAPPAAAPVELPPPEPSDVEDAVLPTALVASSLVVGGVLGAVAVRRRRQLRARPAGHRIAVPPDVAGRLEWVGAHQQTPAFDVVALDAALRSLTLTDWSGSELPDLTSVRLSPEAAVIGLAAHASPPDPFTSDDSPLRWRLDAAAALPLAPDEAGGHCAPFPLLVSVASRGDTTLLLDLERLGVLGLIGPRERTAGLLRHIAAELANSRWAEDVEILLAGFSTELIALNPERLTAVPDLRAGIAEIQHRIRSARDNTQRLPVASVLDGRMRDVASDSWLPVVLLATGQPSTDELDAVEELADDLRTHGRLAAAIVLAGDVPGAGNLAIDEDGTVSTTDADDGPWTAESLTEETATGLAAILNPTSEPYPEAGPAAVPDRAWARDMSADGSLALPLPPRDQSDDDSEDDSDDDLGELGDEPADEPVESSGSPAPAARPLAHAVELQASSDIASDADPVALRRLAVVDHQDPDLDDDLRRWNAPGRPDRPLISILGKPEVRAPGDLPSARPGWFTEVLVYLSLHPAGVSISKALTDLWPEGKRVSVATVRHAFYGARRWAGRGLDGDPAAAFVSDMQHDSTYRLRGHLLDWDLFRRLRKRAQARAAALHPGAVADYRAALELIRGPVLSGLRHDGYAWLNNHDQRHDLQIPGFVVDTAHELVDLALAAGDTAFGRWAAETARSVDVDVAFDRPLTDLMRIAHAENNPSEMERYAAILLDAREFDVPEELPPDTFKVLNELLPNGPRRRRS